MESTAGFGSKVTYIYDSKGRLARQTIDGTPIDYEYTKYGQLSGKHLGGKLNPHASVIYEYSKSGKVIARTANDIRQTYVYDKKWQLLAVKDADGQVVERYAYDKAGNMLKKQVNGKTTTFTFDDANQLISSTAGGVTTRYTYDAAGRLVREGDKTYHYGYLDKVMSVTENDKTYTYSYHPDGQLATASYGASHESFTWDGLALIRRGDEQFINEPHVGGGNPVVSSKGTSYFNDMLGTTIGLKANDKYYAATLTAFGENLSAHSQTSNYNSNFFAGKPQIDGLGHAFLFRNYHASLAKWRTADPYGYPDGWNRYCYCANRVTHSTDYAGANVYNVVDSEGAVLDAGHSAWIIGDEQNGYSVYDYQANGLSGSGVSGSSSNGQTRTQDGFSSLEEALNYLNSNRDGEHKFDKGQMWETTPEEDAAAKIAANSYCKEDYSLLGHNCYDIGPDAIFDAVNNLRSDDKKIDVDDGPSPNSAFNANIKKGALIWKLPE